MRTAPANRHPGADAPHAAADGGWSWWRRYRIAAGVLLALLVPPGILVKEHLVGRWRFDAYRKTLRDQGIALTAAELPPPRSLPKEYECLPVAVIDGLLAVRDPSTEVGVPFELPQATESQQPGFAVPAWRLAAPRTEDGGHRNWPEIRTRMADTFADLQAVRRRLLERPFTAPVVEPTVTAQIPSIFRYITVARYLNVLALAELEAGRPEACLDTLLAALRLNESLAPGAERHLVVHIGYLAMGAINSRAVWACLQYSDWSDAQLAALQAAWGRLDPAGLLPLVIQGELVFGMEILRQPVDALGLRGSPLFAAGAGGTRTAGPAGSGGAIGALLDSLAIWGGEAAIAAGGYAWADFNRLTYAQIMRTNLDGATRLAATRDLRTISDLLATQTVALNAVARSTRFGTRDWSPRSMACVLLMPKLAEVMAETARAATRREMIITAIVLHRYRLGRGEWPERLEELTPALLAGRPHDWLGGRPLTYRRNEDGTFTLYSVGENGADDGGDPTSESEGCSAGFFAGRDWVWARLADHQEAVTAEWARTGAAGRLGPDGGGSAGPAPYTEVGAARSSLHPKGMSSPKPVGCEVRPAVPSVRGPSPRPAPHRMGRGYPEGG
ncbi:MAG: hypothetical protein H7A45_03290 [Verrucomicrobiales bacterium]|nr:hypothetical protein [Verrucomicrobiales bacterium]MCP5527783.1 hypothetical protein [Verrucomicrobiales bacterium]